MTDRGSVRADSVRTALALRAVIDETRRLFHLLARAAETVHLADGLAGGERAVLVELADAGPRTVPEMARARTVSRQHIQSVVNALASRGLVELVENPRHRRSRLVRATQAGCAVVSQVRGREGRVVAGLAPRLEASNLEVTSRTLAQLGRLFRTDVAAMSSGDGARPHGDDFRP
jgi:DNA-binding MarR family transcriptional regulator